MALAFLPDVGLPLRVLLVNKYAEVIGGADRHCLDLLTRLGGRGHDVALLAFKSGGAEADPPGIYLEPFVTHSTRGEVRGGDRVRAALRSLWNRSAAAATAAAIERFRPDVVHVHKIHPQISVAPVVTAARSGVPIVQTAHDYEFVSAHPEDEFGRKVDRLEESTAFRLLNTSTFVLRQVAHRPLIDHWIVVSPHMQRVYRAAGIDASVLRDFVEPDIEPNVPIGQRSGIVFTGRLSERKGVQDVLEVARARPALSFTVAGSGPLAAAVESAAQALPNLRYLGFVDRGTARDLVRTAQAVLVPSRWAEPGGLVALEAMAVGTPVVAYRRGGLVDYVGDTEGGLLTDASPEALGAALDRLCEEPDLWHSCSTAGPEGLRSRHDPEAYLVTLESIYRQVRG